MLRPAIACLLLASALLLPLHAFPTDESAGGTAHERRDWASRDFRVVNGTQVRTEAAAATIRLDEQGRAVVEVDAGNLDLAALPLLHLRFGGRPDVSALIVAWRTPDSGARPRNLRIGVSPSRSFWLDMREYGDWSGRATAIAVILLGPPGSEVELASLSLSPAVFPATLFADIAQWTVFVPWTHASINSHLGLLTPGNAPYPAVVAALALAAGVVVYLIAVAVSRGRLPFRWSVVGAITFFCWLALDWPWQNKLLRQSEVTRGTLAGKTNTEKRQTGMDSAIFEFTRRVKDAIGGSDARVFIASTSDYRGMRGAYYLYPNNVYWKRHAKTLPEQKNFAAGDFVVLFPPVQVGYDRNSGHLQYGKGQRLRAELLFSEGSGALFRVL